MIKRICTVVALGWLLALPAIGQATPPKKVEPAYDPTTRTLSVAIRHWSFADRVHFVKSVEVSVNGQSVLVEQREEQPDNDFTYTYTIDAAPGDLIEVKARCNLWGSRVGSLTLPGGPGGAAR